MNSNSTLQVATCSEMHTVGPHRGRWRYFGGASSFIRTPKREKRTTCLVFVTSMLFGSCSERLLGVFGFPSSHLVALIVDSSTEGAAASISGFRHFLRACAQILEYSR